MNVLYIERCLAENSLVFDQIQRLGKTDIDYHCLAIQVGKYPDFNHPKVTSVRCPFFPKLERLKSALFCRAAMKAFASFPGRDEVDLIHAHFAYPDGLAAYEISKRHGIPYVITGRGSDILLYPGRGHYLRSAISTVLQNSSLFIGVSKHIIDRAVSLGTAKDRCAFQPDGVPSKWFFYEPEKKNRQKSKTILFAGAFLPVKNILKMVNAFICLNKADPTVTFRLIGDGSLRPELETLIAESGCAGKFDLPGHLSHAQLAEAMKQADVLCLPSISEGWGNVITEAMACGTPVVASKVGGIPEQIISGDYGFLCDPTSIEDIAGKLLLALNKDWDHQQIAKHGGRCTRESAAESIASLYVKTLNKMKSHKESCHQAGVE